MKEPSPQQPSLRSQDEKSESRRILAEDLFAGTRELRIVHDGEEYRLSITRNRKLILTK